MGRSAIPERFISGLEDTEEILELAILVAQAALENKSPDDLWYWPKPDKVTFDASVIAKYGHKHPHTLSKSSKYLASMLSSPPVAGISLFASRTLVVAIGTLFMLRRFRREPYAQLTA